MRHALALGLLATVAGATPAAAQVQPGHVVLFATYECDQTALARADQIVQTMAAPVLDRHVAEGNILSWGYLSAVIGQEYNRSFYIWATDAVSLMEAREQYLPEIQAQADFAEFASVCEATSQTIHTLTGN